MDGGRCGLVVTGNDNRVTGSYFGTKHAGEFGAGTGNDGILVNGGGNTIGGALPGDRNLLSANGENGIHVQSGTEPRSSGISSEPMPRVLKRAGTRTRGNVASDNGKHGIEIIGPGGGGEPGGSFGEVVSHNLVGIDPSGVRVSGASTPGQLATATATLTPVVSASTSQLSPCFVVS